MIVSAVLSPGCQMKAISSRSVSSFASALLMSPLVTIFCANSLAVNAMAIVTDGDHNAVAAMRRRERYRTSTWLANGFSLLRRFKPMVNRIADHVNQRVGKLIDHPLVELGFFAVDLEGYLLARGEAQVTNHAPKAFKKRTDRHHPGIEYSLLQSV